MILLTQLLIQIHPTLQSDKSLKSYPLNVETRHVKTYAASDPPANQSTGLVSVEMSNSMILKHFPKLN